MKQFFSKPRSIISAVVWGSLAAVVTFAGLIAADFILSTYRSNFGPARQIEAIAVGNGYSISLDATPAHPMLAEFEQSIRIFGGGPRDGEMIGSVKIPTNTGGRVRIGVLVPKDRSKAEVVLADRYATTRIALASQKTRSQESWKDPSFVPLGIVSGESYPIKFIACQIWPSLSDDEQRAIVHEQDGLTGFCDAAAPDQRADRAVK